MASGHLAYDSLDVDGHVYFVYEGVVFFTDGERAHWVDGVLDGEPPDAYAWCHEVAALLMEEAGNIAERRWHLRQAARHCERADLTGERRWRPERRPRVDRRRLISRSGFRRAAVGSPGHTRLGRL